MSRMRLKPDTLLHWDYDRNAAKDDIPARLEKGGNAEDADCATKHLVLADLLLAEW